MEQVPELHTKVNLTPAAAATADDPRTVAARGFDPTRLRRAMDLLERGINAGAFPGAVALIARHGTVVASRALGLAEQVPQSRLMTVDMLFDVASITKVVAGLSAVLVLVDAGVWRLDDAVTRFIPEFRGGGKEVVTVRQLLTHTSGLPPWRPCYTVARAPGETFAYICAMDLEAPPGSQVQYSDLGMAMIRALVLRASGEDLPSLLRRALFAPLGAHDMGYAPPSALHDRVAATEDGNLFERGMVARAGQRFDGWREGVLVGEANDGNTHYALEGVSGHAGLFATASDLARFGQLYLQEGLWEGRRLLSGAAIAEALRPQTASLSECYGLGWRLNKRSPRHVAPPVRSNLTRAIFPDDAAASPPVSPFGHMLSPQAYGHTGFTGTSLVVDPARSLLMVLLTNSIHPRATRSRALGQLRERWHNAVVTAITDPTARDAAPR